MISETKKKGLLIFDNFVKKELWEMIKKELTNKKVVRAITLGLSAAMLTSTMGSMPVYASDNVIDNYGVCEGEGVDTSGADYHNDEAAEVADNSQSVKDMNEQVAIAQAAATAAEAAVTEAKNAVAAATTNAEAATTNAATATTNAEAATTAATAAQTEVDNLQKEDASADKNIDAYNKHVAMDQKVVDAVEIPTAVTVDNGDGTKTEVALDDLEEYVDEKANAAQEAADEAKAALEKALAVETDEVTEEVKAAVKEVEEAAKEAADAADEAIKAVDAAKENEAAAIKEYNLYAMSYGLPLYGEKEVTYTDEEAKAAVEAAGMTYQVGKREYLQGKKEEIENKISAANLADKEKAIDAATAAVATATSAAQTAVAAAQTAATTAKTAQESINTYDTTASTAAEAVNNYYVTPAESALKATSDAMEAKKDEIKDLNSALESAKTEAAKAGEEEYNTELANKAANVTNKEAAKNAKYQLWKDTPDWRVVTKAILRAEYEDAKEEYNDAVSAYNDYNKQTTKDSVVNNYVANDSDVITAQAKINTANTELGKLEEQSTKESAILAAEEATRDAYIAATVDANSAREKFVKEIKDILSDYSDEINQIDYDEDLNEWANDTFNTVHLACKWKVRDEMKKYQESELEKLVNTLAITQWIVDTDSAEAVMDAMRVAYRDSMEDYYEKLAVAEANWAAMDTEAAKTAVATEAAKLTAVNNTISAANTAVTNANTELTTAQATYKNAKEELEDLKDNVKEAKFDSITLAELQKKIAVAQEAVNEAKEELEVAQTAKATAERYANWANELVKDHYARAYSQAVEDENGVKVPVKGNLKEYDTTNENVTSRPTADFVCVTEGTTSVKVPYAIYRDYVEAMYAYNDFGKNGKGTSTGSNMDVVFWELDENGILTGKSFTSEADLTDGTYFVAYSFKKEGDGYHFDGIMYEYTKPVVNVGGTGDDVDDDNDDDDTTPVVVPVVAPAAAPVVTPVATVATAGAGQAVVNIDDEATPLAGGIGGNAEGGEGEVIVADADEVEPAIVAIEDEETPLAAGLEADGKGMSWWWLLIVALLGATGYKMYQDHQKRKEEAKEV